MMLLATPAPIDTVMMAIRLWPEEFGDDEFEGGKA